MDALSVSCEGCKGRVGEGRADAYDFEKDVADGEGLALALFPRSNTTLGHGGAHGGHCEPGEGVSPCGGVQACWRAGEGGRRGRAGDVRRATRRARAADIVHDGEGERKTNSVPARGNIYFVSNLRNYL